jgi:hypothetical protein
MARGKAWLRRAVLVLPMLPIGAGVSTNVWADGLKWEELQHVSCCSSLVRSAKDFMHSSYK